MPNLFRHPHKQVVRRQEIFDLAGGMLKQVQHDCILNPKILLIHHT